MKLTDFLEKKIEGPEICGAPFSRIQQRKENTSPAENRMKQMYTNNNQTALPAQTKTLNRTHIT
jgi:hypothetical protein